MQKQASQTPVAAAETAAQNHNSNGVDSADATSAEGFYEGPDDRSLVKMLPQAPETPATLAVQIHYHDHRSSSNPDPNPPGVDSTVNAGAAMSAMSYDAACNAHAINAGATSAAGCFEGPYAQNCLNSYGPGVATNGTDQLVDALVNSLASRNEFLEKVGRHLEWCEVCEIECTSKEVLESHKQGRKHKRKLEILEGSLAPAPVTPAVPDNPIIIPQEELNKKNKVSSEPEDVESKIKRVVDNGTAVDNLKTCEVCNIVCNSSCVLQKHLDGKSHKKNLEKTEASLTHVSVTPQPDNSNKESSEPDDIESKRKRIVDSGTTVDNLKTCEICSVVCNSGSVFQNHLFGTKHKKNLEKTEASGTHVSVTPLVPDNSSIEQDVESKKMNIVENVPVVDIVKTCELCNVLCNSEIVFQNHLAGKVHKKNLLKTGASVTSSSVALVEPNNLIIRPKKKSKKKRKAKANKTEDLASKKRKIVEGGAPVNAVKTCEICNIVCNNDLVFKYHLVGKKHLSMLRKNSGEAPVAITT